jgi:hypothetical protein
MNYTYTTLLAALQATLENTESELVAALDDLIPRGELRLLRDLDFTIFDVTNENIGNMTNGVNTLAKPTGFLISRAVFYIDADADERVFLEPRSREYVLDYWKSTVNYAPPVYHSDGYNTAQILISPPPDLDYQWGAIYMKRPDGLTSSNATTWLGDNVGDCLLHACLIETEKFDIEDERLPMWTTEYARLVTAAKREFNSLIATRYNQGAG